MLNKLIKIIIIKVFITLIVGCEIEPNSKLVINEPGDEKQSSVEYMPTVNPPLSTLINETSGAELYSNLCESCHGKAKQSFINKITHTELNILQDQISRTMPLDNPGICVNECAFYIASFIIKQISFGISTDILEQTYPAQTTSDTNSPQFTKELTGAELYITMCVSCHGAIGQNDGFAVPISNVFELSILEALIDHIMPLGNATECIKECALKITNYIVSEFQLINSLTNVENVNSIPPVDETNSIPMTNQLTGAELYNELCTTCHGKIGQADSTSIAINNNFDLSSLINKIDQSMPPTSSNNCVNTCAEKVATYILTSFSSLANASGTSNPGGVDNTGSTGGVVNVEPTVNIRNAGNVTLHRLNRAEYNNTIRDLLLTEEKPALGLPADDYGYGFDNIANVLSLSPLHVEIFESSASSLSEAVAIKKIVENISVRKEAESLLGTSGVAYTNEWMLFSNGSISTIYQITEAGDYTFTANVWGTQGGSELVSMDILFDGMVTENVSVPNTESNPGIFQITKSLQPGPIEFGVAFINDYSNTATGEDRNLLVDWLQVEGPNNVVPIANPYREILISCDPNIIGVLPCATQVMTKFTRQAWRRPESDLEINDLLSLFNTAIQQGDSFDTGIALAVKAILLSPHFIFRVELDSETIAGTYPLTAYELASRLSYFLWSTTPDAELISLADSGDLLLPTTIAQQVERMLADPKAIALVNNFSGQWLHTRGLSDLLPDTTLFPNWTQSLNNLFQIETQTFFKYLMQSDVSMNELLTANYSFMNTELASYYGLTSSATDFQKIDLPINRKGFLTQGSFLAVTSLPTRTSVVKRGKWVLSNLLCSEPPPPPPNIPGIPSSETPSGSLREIMELHRQNPVCASCHSMMDPIGFSLEHFNAIGQWRDQDNGFDIDDSGQLPDGTTFQGAQGLAQVIVDDPRYSACVVEKLFTYALGRGPQSTDSIYLNEIDSAWSTQGMQFYKLVSLIAQSEPFTSRYTDGMP